MNHLPYHEKATGLDTALGAQPVPPIEEIAMLWCTRDAQLQGITETILLVEDEGFVREVAGEILSSAGYRVLQARSAEDALGAYKQCDGQVDLLLADIMLPGENGNTLAGKLRMEDPEIKVLFITGYVEQIGKRETGGDREECLPKPFSAQALLQGVRDVLDENGKQRKSGNVFKHAAGNG